MFGTITLEEQHSSLAAPTMFSAKHYGMIGSFLLFIARCSVPATDKAPGTPNTNLWILKGKLKLLTVGPRHRMLIFSHLGGEKVFIIVGKNKIFYQVILPEYLVGKNQQQQQAKQNKK